MQAKKVVPRKVLPGLPELQRWSAPSSGACWGELRGRDGGLEIRPSWLRIIYYSVCSPLSEQAMGRLQTTKYLRKTSFESSRKRFTSFQVALGLSRQNGGGVCEQV